MDNKKHTPGPWHVQNNVSDGNQLRVDAQEGAVAILIPHGIRSACEYSIGNAHLIAAAPEMLEALERIAQELDDAGNLDLLSDETRDLLAAISNKFKKDF